MSYDGERLRVKKTENGVTTYYLRSSVLGGQVLAEISPSGNWNRGYVYLGSQLLALQDNGVYFVHQDPVTKGQRVTTSTGSVDAVIEVDPWGGETWRSVNSSRQPRKYTSYERDGTQADEAMHRRYNRWWSRFDQPDPSDGSYDLSDPQSFNRYAYVQNDPINFVDPSGLNMASPGTRYGGDPMGVAYYVDGMLSDARTALGLLESGAGVVGPASMMQWDPSANMGQGEWLHLRARADGQMGWYTMQGYMITVTATLSYGGQSWFAGSASYFGVFGFTVSGSSSSGGGGSTGGGDGTGRSTPTHRSSDVNPNPYSSCEDFIKVNAAFMYRYGGNGNWGQHVRQSLITERNNGAGMGRAHINAYLQATLIHNTTAVPEFGYAFMAAGVSLSLQTLNKLGPKVLFMAASPGLHVRTQPFTCLPVK